MNDINAPAPPMFGIGEAVKHLKEGKRVKVRADSDGGFFMLSKPNAHGEQALMHHVSSAFHGPANITWIRHHLLFVGSVMCEHWELLQGEWEAPDYPV